MSIKRTSKSIGTAARKPVTASGVRHVDVVAPRQMVAADLYSGWLCKNKPCGLVIAIAPSQAGGKPGSAGAEDQIVIKCPHCGDENLYRWSTRGEHKYTLTSAG